MPNPYLRFLDTPDAKEAPVPSEAGYFLQQTLRECCPIGGQFQSSIA